MKTFLIILTFIFLNALCFGQDFIVAEQTATMSKGTFNCLTMELPGSDQKTIVKSWGNFIKSVKGKTKFDRKTNETFTDDALIKEMSENTVDLYAIVQPKGEGTSISVWFNLGVTYLSSNEFPDRYPHAHKLLIDFGYYVAADLIAGRLKEKQKELKDEEKDLKKIEKARTKYEKNIEKYKKVIAKAETSIKENEDEIEKNRQEEAKQSEVIGETKTEIDEIKRLLQEAKKRAK